MTEALRIHLVMHWIFVSYCLLLESWYPFVKSLCHGSSQCSIMHDEASAYVFLQKVISFKAVNYNGTRTFVLLAFKWCSPFWLWVGRSWLSYLDKPPYWKSVGHHPIQAAHPSRRSVQLHTSICNLCKPFVQKQGLHRVFHWNCIMNPRAFFRQVHVPLKGGIRQERWSVLSLNQKRKKRRIWVTWYYQWDWCIYL